jgi:hypothetical protein
MLKLEFLMLIISFLYTAPQSISITPEIRLLVNHP